jgi:hypothetical protein
MDVIKNVRGGVPSFCPRRSISLRLKAIRREFDVHVIKFTSCRIYGFFSAHSPPFQCNVKVQSPLVRRASFLTIRPPKGSLALSAPTGQTSTQQ